MSRSYVRELLHGDARVCSVKIARGGGFFCVEALNLRVARLAQGAQQVSQNDGYGDFRKNRRQRGNRHGSGERV